MNKCDHGIPINMHCGKCFNNAQLTEAASANIHMGILRRELADLSVTHQEALIKLETAKDELAEAEQQLAQSERQRIEQSEHLKSLETEIAKAVLENAALTAQLAQYQQAEPAGWYVQTPDGLDYSYRVVLTREEKEQAEQIQGAIVRPLYATPQPAAVVVLPEAMPYDGYSGHSYENGRSGGHNNCLAEVRRLNAEVTTVQELERLRGCEPDAARYRWLRKYYDGVYWFTSESNIEHLQKQLDSDIDAAIQASQSQGES